MNAATTWLSLHTHPGNPDWSLSSFERSVDRKQAVMRSSRTGDAVSTFWQRTVTGGIYRSFHA